MSRAMDGWTTPHDAAELLSQMSRQADLQDRRTRIPNAAQILGPGLGPRATLLVDWNAEETLFNGIFYSEVGALNSPDPAAAWVGSVYASASGMGVMQVLEMATLVYDGVAPREYRRAFATSPAGARSFTAWEVVPTPPVPEVLPGGVALNLNGPWGTAAPGPTTGTSFDCKAGVLRGVANATAYNTTATLINLYLYVDGVAYPGFSMAMFPNLTTGVHMALSTLAFAIPVTAGTHYVYFRQINGVSDFQDVGSFSGIVTPT